MSDATEWRKQYEQASKRAAIAEARAEQMREALEALLYAINLGNPSRMNAAVLAARAALKED